jgi:hypothetical protein
VTERRRTQLEFATLTLAACALLLPGALEAQTFKCVDAYGKITYSGKKCSDLGLKDAGEVKDRLNVNPAYQPPARSDKPQPQPARAPAPAPAAQAPETPPAAEEPGTPDRRCFTVNGPKGKVTRCNDTPPD